MREDATRRASPVLASQAASVSKIIGRIEVVVKCCTPVMRVSII